MSLYDLLRLCTVRVSIPSGYGTGFFVAQSMILTCAHVIKNTQSNNLMVFWQDQPYPAQIIKTVEVYDLAILQVNLVSHPCVYLDKEVQLRDPLDSYGYSDTSQGGDTITGEYEGWATITDGQLLLKFKQAHVRPGLSGAPLLNERTGFVCGIVKQSRDRNNDLGGRAIPASTILDALPELSDLQKIFHEDNPQWCHTRRKHLKNLTAQNMGERINKENQNYEREHVLLQLNVNYRDSLTSLLRNTDTKNLELSILPKQFWKDAPTVPEVDLLADPSQLTTSITAAYKRIGKEVLIVGDAGAGKSTLLIMLGQDLVKRAEYNDNDPIPFIVHLSNWVIRKLPLQEWASGQIEQDYNISRKLNKRWFQENKILLLLDGLDEIDLEDRLACITEINAYHLSYTGPLVVCCRTGAYAAACIYQRLNLRSIMVQPLTSEQVNESLVRAGEPFTSLVSFSNEDPVMKEIIRNPLMLRFLLHLDPQLIVRQLSQSSEQKSSEQVTSLRLEIIENYVHQQMSPSRETPTSQSGETPMSSSYTAHQMQRGLTFLAQEMRKQKERTFYVERLQPDGLPKHFFVLYNQLATKGIGFLLGFLMGISINAVIFGGDQPSFDILYGLLGGLIGILVSGASTSGFRFSTIIDTLKHQWLRLLLFGSLNAVLIGLSVYLAFILYPSDGYHEELVYGYGMGASSFFLTLLILGGKIIAPQAAQVIPSNTFVQKLWKRVSSIGGLKTDHCKLGLGIGVITGLSIGISVGLSGELSNGYGKSAGLSSGLSNGLSTGLTIGLSYTAIGIMLCLSLLGKEAAINVTDMIGWSFKGFGRQLKDKKHLSITFYLFLFILGLFGLGIGLSIGSSNGWAAGLRNGLIFGLSAALSVSSAYWILFAFWTGGVSSKTIEDTLRTVPNQGIRRSFQMALQIFLYGGILCILMGLSNEILYYGLIHGFSRGVCEGVKALLRDGLFIACFGALLPALFMGGITVLRHYLLRFLFKLAGILPFHIVNFLDDATSRNLLRKVGKGGGYQFTHNYVFEHFANQEH